MDTETLKTELALPAYAALIATGDDQGICDLLNALGAGTVSRGVISKDQFVMALSRGLAAILGKPETDPVRQAFSGWLALLAMVTNVDTKDPAVLGTLATAVQAGVFTQAEVDAATLRPCSRPEQLAGPGTVASVSDVAATLHDQRQAAYEQAQAAIREHAEKLIAEQPEMDLREALERADQAINGSDWGRG